MELKALYKKIPQFLNKYRYVILILLVGIVFMLLPSTEQKSSTSVDPPETTAVTDTSFLNQQLSEILSRIEGAGQVQVLLTQGRGEEVIYQTDSDITNSENENTTHITTVTVTSSERDETGLIRQVNPPSYLGAIVVCQGAESPTIRLAITEAVSNVTGLGVDRITVLKMK